MKRPNSLPETKDEYLRALVLKRVYAPNLLDAALIYYHSEIPLEEAKGYLSKLAEKLSDVPVRRNPNVAPVYRELRLRNQREYVRNR